MADLVVQTAKVPQFTTPTSKFGAHLPPCPMRMVVLGPSGSGKTMLLQDVLTRMYKSCFERVYIFSPSCIIDKSWQPVHDMVAKMDYAEDEPPAFYEKWDPEALERILETQTEVVKLAKDKGMKSIPGIIVVIDDFADRPCSPCKRC